MLAQFAGGTLGLASAVLILGEWAAHPTVGFVATRPASSLLLAFGAELLISGLMMTVVLNISNRPRLAPYTGWCAAACVAIFITLEAPISGMSMNPARTFASFTHAGGWRDYWIYLLAPPLGMLGAAEIYRATSRLGVACAKMRHVDGIPCLFCDHQQRLKTASEK
jgi:aquaporin Z